jgi:acetyl-CoA/propionyl-CoA carboxylase carboxyl transferase subunit
LADEHARLAGGVETAVAIGVVDEIIEPGRTRSTIAAALQQADCGVRGEHTNIPL